MERIELNGKVFSSLGEGKIFLELPWVKRQIKQKLGFTPYAGTLNIRLSDESANQRKLLENAAFMKIRPAEGYCNGKLIKASIGKLDCAIVVPEVAGYPKGAIEIIAPVNLRETLQLEDGGEVKVSVNL